MRGELREYQRAERQESSLCWDSDEYRPNSRRIDDGGAGGLDGLTGHALTAPAQGPDGQTGARTPPQPPISPGPPSSIPLLLGQLITVPTQRSRSSPRASSMCSPSCYEPVLRAALVDGSIRSLRRPERSPASEDDGTTRQAAALAGLHYVYFRALLARGEGASAPLTARGWSRRWCLVLRTR